MKIRNASHSGSWYSSNGSKLAEELGGWLSKTPRSEGKAKAIIVPHAGYSYCGKTAAYAYNQIDPSRFKRIFILGPSHHVHIRRCALSTCDSYATPMYDLEVDKAVCNKLMEHKLFETMDKSVDEDEHSLEMQLPFIAKIMQKYKDNFTIVPIMVGSISSSQEHELASVLAPHFSNPDTLFVISSDFCHWGTRFGYTYLEEDKGDVWESIEYLDRKGMKYIEMLDSDKFSNYLNKYGNTICGRIPISIMVKIVEKLRDRQDFDMNFLDYSQSSKCLRTSDSSVSYAAGVLSIK